MTERDKRIDEMLDREAIRDLPVRYCHYVRQKDVEAVLDLFSDNCVFDVGDGGGDLIGKAKHSGKDVMRTFFSEGFVRVDPWPFVHNHVVNLTGPDRAKGWVYMEMRGGPKLRTASIVVYEDDYVKENGRWRFQKRALTLTGIPE